MSFREKLPSEREILWVLAFLVVAICLINFIDFFYEKSWALLSFSSYKVLLGFGGLYTLREQSTLLNESFAGVFAIGYIAEACAVLSSLFVLRADRAVTRWCAESIFTSICHKTIPPADIKAVGICYFLSTIIYTSVASFLFMRLSRVGGHGRFTRATCRWLSDALNARDKAGEDQECESMLVGNEYFNSFSDFAEGDSRPSDWDECSRFTPDRTTKVTVSFRKRVSENNGNDFAAVASRFLHRRGSKLSKFTNGSKASAWSNSLASRIIKEPRKPILSSKTLRSRASAASNVSRNYLV